jgi:hypothetical protein
MKRTRGGKTPSNWQSGYVPRSKPPAARSQIDTSAWDAVLYAIFPGTVWARKFLMSTSDKSAPYLEPSHIYDFQRVPGVLDSMARPPMAKDERILFGTKTTDYGIMDD